MIFPFSIADMLKSGVTSPNLIEIEWDDAPRSDFAGLQAALPFSKGGNCLPEIGNLAILALMAAVSALPAASMRGARNDDHVPSHCRIGVAQARRVHAF